MALTKETVDRLKSTLLTSGLQQKDQPLFQVINLLIDAVRQSMTDIAAVTGGGGGGGGGILAQSFLTMDPDSGTLPNSAQLVTSNLNINRSGNRFTVNAPVPFPIDGEDGLDGIGIPGPQGLQGPSGLMGPPGMDCGCEGGIELYPTLPFTNINDIAFKSLENIFTDLFGIDIQRSGTARLSLRRTNSGADDKQWYIQLQGDELSFTTDTDARDSPSTVAQLSREGLLSILSNLRIGGLAAGSGLLINIVNSVHRLTPTTFQIANAGIHNLGLNSQSFHFLFLLSGTTGQMAIFAVHGGLQVTNLVYSSGAFSITAGTAASTNVYWSAGNVRYEIQNNLGSAVDYYAVAIGV